MNKPTLTQRETVNKLRDAGFESSEPKLQAGIEQGVYPFGICINLEKSKVYEIYACQVDKWIKERTT